jgi:hypothetical protein
MREVQEMPCKYVLNLDDVKSEKIKRKYYYTPSSNYLILNYDKKFMSFDDTNTGMYRSVIFSYPDKNVVCFSTPKSIPFSVFNIKYPLITNNIFINEALEGVAVNLFYDKTIDKWNISTKNSIGGKYWFYGKKDNSSKQVTFLEMFMDAIHECEKRDLNDVAIFEYLPKEYCYNFILQHSENAILLPVQKSKLYLIGVYSINNNEVEYISQKDYQTWDIFRQLDGIIHFPKEYNVSNYNNLFLNNRDITKGYMVTNIETGERTKILNKKYEDLKDLLSIKPQLQYQYLCLNHIGKEKVEEYLQLFPKLKKEFYVIKQLYKEFIKNVFISYLTKYVYKDDEPILEKYQSHIYKIHHNLYLPLLNKNTITRIRYKNVVDYFNKMEPRELMYILNWDCRNL